MTAALELAATAAPYRQSDDHFIAALKNRSTSPSFILITAEDARNRSTRTDCTLAPLLLGAIHKEHQLPYDSMGDEVALNIALAAKDHFFSFRSPQALANITFDGGSRYQRACALIRSGKPAIMMDRSGAVQEGLPDLP